MKYKNYNIVDNELLLNFNAKFHKIPRPPSGRLSAKIDVD